MSMQRENRSSDGAVSLWLGTMSAMPVPQSEATKGCIQRAHNVAADFRSHYVELIHFFIFLLRVHPHLLADFIDAPVAVLLDEAEEAASQRPHRRNRPDPGTIPVGAECIRVIAHADDEAVLGAQRLVLPIHLLTAILNEQGTSAAQIMKKHGVTLNKLRARYVWSEQFLDNEA